ncbi:hypothetical protein HK105_200491 [Polyrhizophydium stewartii]|uniref:CKK domain-containing protein n=1 Tax=Polyrhizophydium stewartii TaxID=2732419 RepID=A0ABR4NJH0_9FUNG
MPPNSVAPPGIDASDIAFAGSLVGRDDLDASHASDGFVLLQLLTTRLRNTTNASALAQLLSLIAPAAVDLAWYTTDAAMACPDLPLRNHTVLAQGIRDVCAAPPHPRVPALLAAACDPAVQSSAKAGDEAACVRILSALCDAYCLVHGVERAARTAQASGSPAVASAPPEQPESSSKTADASVASTSTVRRRSAKPAQRRPTTASAKQSVNLDTQTAAATVTTSTADSAQTQGGQTRTSVSAPVASLLDRTAEEDLLLDDERYTPAEPTFRPLVRWIIHRASEALQNTTATNTIASLALSDEHDAFAAKLAIARSELDDPLRRDLSRATLDILCSTQAYNIVTQELFGDATDAARPPTHEERPVERALTDPLDLEFLETLMKQGYLHFQHSLMGSLRDIISDQTPFYESIHSNVIAALLSASLRHTSVDVVVAHLTNGFASFDPQHMYPYDLEDAMLIWVNQCLLAVKHSRGDAASPTADAVRGDVGDICELDDLAKGLQDGRALCGLFAAYFPAEFGREAGGMFWKDKLTSEHQASNWRAVERLATVCLGVKRLPWLPADLRAIERQRAASTHSSSNSALCTLFISFLVDAFEVCGTRLPIGAARSDVTGQAVQAPAATVKAIDDGHEQLPPKSRRVSKSRAKLRDRPASGASALASQAFIEPPLQAASAAAEESNQLPMPIPSDFVDASARSVEDEASDSPAADVVPLVLQESPPSQAPAEIAPQLVRAQKPSRKPVKHVKLDNTKHHELCVDDEEDGDTGNGNGDDSQDNPNDLEGTVSSAILIQPHMRALLVEDDEEDEHDSSLDHAAVEAVDATAEPPTPASASARAHGFVESATKAADGNDEDDDDDGDAGADDGPGISDAMLHHESIDQYEDGHDAASPEPLRAAVQPDRDVHRPAAAASGTPLASPVEFRHDAESDSDGGDGGEMEQYAPTKDHHRNGMRVVAHSEAAGAAQAASESDSDISVDREPPPLRPIRKRKPAAPTSTARRAGNPTPKRSGSPGKADAGESVVLDAADVARGIDSHLGTSSAAEPPSRAAAHAPAPPQTLPPKRQRPRTGLQAYPLQDSGDVQQASSSTHDAEKPPPEQPQQRQSKASHHNDDDPDAKEKWNRVQMAKGFASPPSGTKGKVEKKSTVAKLEQIQKQKAERDEARAKAKEECERIREAQRREQAEIQLKRVEERAMRRSAAAQEGGQTPPRAGSQMGSRHRGSDAAQHADAAAPNPASFPADAAASPAKAAPKRRAASFVKPQSNRTLITNALMHVCLAGSANATTKQQVMEDLRDSPASHFVILFRDVNNFSFRGLYSWDPVLDQTLKVYAGSLGPNVLDSSSVIEFYKYDSGARTFKTVPTRSFGRSVHAVAIGRDVPVHAAAPAGHTSAASGASAGGAAK